MHGPFTLDAVEDVTDWIGPPHGVGDAAFQITGTFVATITFEACVEGNEADAVPIAVCNIATPGTIVTSATAPGLFKTENGLAGGLKVRARMSAFTSGAAVIRGASSE